ncbi:Hypothetical protein MVR_LOCUS400 [uncultured virus]|nr:Hypothetical protein MVR_LOCUS400 [uncultured virus]
MSDVGWFLSFDFILDMLQLVRLDALGISDLASLPQGQVTVLHRGWVTWNRVDWKLADGSLGQVANRKSKTLEHVGMVMMGLASVAI